MQTTFRTTLFRTQARRGYVLRGSLLLAVLVLASPGCKKSSEPEPKVTSQGQPAETPSPDVATAEAKPEAKPVPSTASTTPAAAVRSDSPFFPAGEIVKIEIDNVVLSHESAYESLMPALVRFLDSAAETEYPVGTSVMRPAIHLNTAAGRTSYMLVPGEPAVRCYLSDKDMPWLYGDDEAYEQLISALERLYGRTLTRG